MVDNISAWLEKRTHTSEELLEILKISEQIQNDLDWKLFYGKLIRVQQGSFSLDVFNAYLNLIANNTDALLNLLKNTVGLTDVEKMEWVKIALVSNPNWFIPAFFKTEQALVNGIDIYKNPFNFLIVKTIVESVSDITLAEGFLVSILESLTNEEFYEWYDNSGKKCQYKTCIAKILAQSKNTTTSILENYFDELDEIDDKIELAKHSNFSEMLKLKLYRLTKDIKFLPQKLKNLFVF